MLCEEVDRVSAERAVLKFGVAGRLMWSSHVRVDTVPSIRLPQESSVPRCLGTLYGDQSASSWFTAPETWKVVRWPRNDNLGVDGMDLLRYALDQLHRWFARWVEAGSNCFIHSQLYRYRYPRCIQDAYTTLLAYIHRTATNEHIILQTIEARATQLVADYSVGTASPPLSGAGASSVPLDSVDHLARVQALLVYQFIGLYHGDIRLRYLAESHIPVFDAWMRQMVEHASQAISRGESIIESPHPQSLTTSDVVPCGVPLWHAWILAESIRRTWLVTSTILAMYSLLQNGRLMPCRGGMMFTTRKGAWEAPSASSWEKICSEVNIGMIQMHEADHLMANLGPHDVNDFAKVFLNGTFSVRKMKEWELRMAR